MNPNRFFVAVVAGLLTAPDQCFARASARAAERYDLEHLQVPGTLGAAVGEDGEERMPMLAWLARKRLEKVCRVTVSVQDPEDDEEAHLLAGFAGGLPLLVELVSGSASSNYLAGTVSGPHLLMTTSELIALLHRQGHASLYWECVLDQINGFNACNGRREVESEELEAYLLGDEGQDAWQVMGDQIFRELQVEACVHDRDFVVPEQMRHLVRAVEPFHDEQVMDVWLEPFDEDAVTGAHLLRLVEAQPFAECIWQQCADKAALAERVGDDFNLDTFPCIPSADWPRYLSRVSADDVVEVQSEIIELVRLECESRGMEPVIPAALEDIFGPDDEERRRLRFRQRLQHDMGWALVSTLRPWRMAVLDRIDAAPPIDHPRSLAQARADFISTLEKIEQFAGRIGSDLAPLFQVAGRLAQQADGRENPRLPEMIEQDARRFGAMRKEVETSIDIFSTFGWTCERTFGLAAISLADVFGGMASWNDQWFEGPDQEVFEELSAELFSALNRYFEALVSFDNSPPVAC